MTDFLEDNLDNFIVKTQQFLQNIDIEIAATEAVNYIQELIEIINFHDTKYYVENENLITDFEYDLLFKKLKSTEEKYPKLITKNSPTQRVAKGLTNDFKTVLHTVPMLSLENSYNEDDINDFIRKTKEAISENIQISYTCEPKFDGSSIALLYENDTLIRAATRGNGIEGDEITSNAKVISSIPNHANFSKFGIKKIELRGEVVIELSVFKELNEERKKQNLVLFAEGKKELELFKNARNTAAGSLRLKDTKEVAARKLDAIIYNIGYAEDFEGNDITSSEKLFSHFQNIDLLHNLGFLTPKNDIQILETAQQIQNYCNSWLAKRDTYHFDIDGMVIKVNETKLQQLIGKTSHHPKWAIAYKFKARQATSILRKVDFQVGRTGAITPVAKIDAVQLMGVEISSISLHNEEFIKDKNIQINDTVLVERAGDVIPYIVGIIPEKRTNSTPILFPKNCPSCNDDLVKTLEESIWRCVNTNCPAQLEEHLIHFVSKEAMNINGFGEENVRTLLRENIITNIESIYTIDYTKIENLQGWKTKSIQNLKDGIEQSKQNELWRLMVGLSIRHCGVNTSKLLAKQVNNLIDFATWQEIDYLHLEDIGPKVAQALFVFFTDQKNINMIQNLEKLGVNTLKTEQVLSSNKLENKTFLFTGTLTQFSRDEAKILVEKNGGKNLSAVSTNLDYLITGEKAGSKLTKAEKITTIKIISENDFLAMINN